MMEFDFKTAVLYSKGHGSTFLLGTYHIQQDKRIVKQFYETKDIKSKSFENGEFGIIDAKNFTVIWINTITSH